MVFVCFRWFLFVLDGFCLFVWTGKKEKVDSVSISRVLCLAEARCLPFIYYAGRPASPAFYPPSYCSGGQPSDDGLHELAAPRWNSPTVARRLVVSYTAFSPLPLRAVILFFQIQLSPTASIFGSGTSCAARTFLSHRAVPAADRNTVYCLSLRVLPPRR